MRVATILARHGTEKYSEAERQLELIFERQFRCVERTTLIVDNALPAEFIEPYGDAMTLIGGDNSAWEFSAWDKGLRFLGEKIWSYDLIHFVTSAFHTLYVKYLDRFDDRMLQAIAQRPVCVGHIDCYNEPVRIGCFESQHWIRTSFLFIPPTEIKLLKSVVSAKEAESWFGEGSREPFANGSGISANYQSYILDWLTGGDIGQGATWHSKIALDARSWPLFKAKATAIFNEHLLAIRLRAQGTRLLDTTWLATQLASKKTESIDWQRPWRKQLAERDADKVIVNSGQQNDAS